MRCLAVSGVNRGIGYGIARLAIRSGWRVIGLGRTPPDWALDYPDQFKFVMADMSMPGGLQQACKGIDDAIDVLICNAATFGGGAFHLDTFEVDALTETFSVNVIAPLVLARSLKSNLERGDRRAIIMMSTGNASLSGNTQGSMLGYRLSKSALNQAVRNLAAEWGQYGFVTVALNPGWVRTGMGGAGAPMSIEEAAVSILRFVDEIVDTRLNGAFVNVDGSALPW